jgi:hypothetical protein
VLDFGLSKDVRGSYLDDAALTSASQTQVGMVMGTPAYMSPEQTSGRPLDHRTDIFSLGVLLHEMSTGKRPFEGTSSAELVSAILRDAPPSVTDMRPDLPSDLARIIRRCLGKDPDVTEAPKVPMSVNELVVGTVCGGSDATSGISANPAVGCAFDMLVEQGAATIFEETGEMVGLEELMSARAVTPDLGKKPKLSVEKAAFYYKQMEDASFAPGNAEGGLTTIEEKSIGAYCKSGDSPISGLLKPGDVPPRGGLYLLDVVPDGEPRFGFPNINDNAEIAELIACGSHIILFTTGRGSVVGSAISPVIKICAIRKLTTE